MSAPHCEACAAGIALRLTIVRGVADLAINYELTSNAEVAATLRSMAEVLEASPESPEGLISVMPR